MNLKSLLAAVGITVAVAAFAEVESSTTLCRIAVSTGVKSTIIALPLQTVGQTDGRTIAPTKVVMPDGLPANTKLLHWNSVKAGWDAWKIANGVWEVEETMPSGDPLDALPCGSAAWLELPANPTSTQTFYLYGQCFETGASVSAVANASTMMGACAAINVNAIKNKLASGTFQEGDKIVVVDPSNTVTGRKEFTYRATKADGTTAINNFAVQTYNASRSPRKDWEVADFTLEAGKGFLYVSKGGTPTFNW